MRFIVFCISVFFVSIATAGTTSNPPQSNSPQGQYQHSSCFPDTLNISNSTFDISIPVLHGKNITVTCDDGYVTPDSMQSFSVLCQDGVFVRSNVCLPPCDLTGIVNNGYVVGNPNLVKLPGGQSVTIQCPTGSSFRVTCIIDGEATRLANTTYYC
jgi:uncharacterized protein YdeI (BOF family)